MCGICGIVRFDGQPVDRAVLQEMNDKLAHRGPDDEGFFVDGPVGIACRRLSIIDVAGGHQPISSADGMFTAAQNGEIYNYRDLRRELADKGCAFHTASDTEVILQAYVAWKGDCARHLNGMFAFAVYDRRAQALFLARDRSGIKPLFCFRSDRLFAFASEIKSLLVLPDVAREPDLAALDSFLKYKYVPGARTMFRGISKVPPASVMTVRTDGTGNESSYWALTPEHFAAAQVTGTGDLRRQLRDTLFKAVERQMVSDVPLGAFLSGGIDSTIIAGIMAKLAPGRVKTFSMGFREQSFNELPFARAAADFHGTEHREFMCEAQSLLELVPGLVEYFDEPLGDASMIPTYLVARETRKHVTVALSGTGADELFAGYDRHRIGSYRAHYAKLPVFLRDRLIPALVRSLRVSGEKKGIVHRARRFLRVAGLSEGQAYEDLTALFPGDDRRALLTPDARGKLAGTDLDGVSRQFGVFAESGMDFLQHAMYADLATILPNDYLTKDDRMSMACSLEVRVPFLDHELIELAARIPSAWKMKKGVSKAILREVFADLIPGAIRRRGKHGFEAPIALWLAGARLEDVRSLLTSRLTADRGIMDTGVINGIIERHASREENCMNQIFSLLVLEFWFRRYID